MSTLSLHERLVKIQTALAVPKNQLNKFGGYKYRSCEDILEALKHHLQEHGVYLTLSDTIEMVGTRFYVKATATLHGQESHISVTAYAREEEVKKGMDSSQITGAASSYARKYALNGLFCIDDTKDSDATNKHEEEKPKLQKKVEKELPKVASSTTEQQGTIRKLAEELGMNVQKDICGPAKFVWPLTGQQAEAVIKRLHQKKAELAKEEKPQEVINEEEAARAYAEAEEKALKTA